MACMEAGGRGRFELDVEGLDECPERGLVGVGSAEKLCSRSFELPVSPKSDNGLDGNAMSRPSDPDPFKGVCDGVEARGDEAEWWM